MNMLIENIRKLMGWCPNAKTLENGSRVSPANFEVYNRSRGEKARIPIALSHFSKLFSRLDIRILLPILLITPSYINFLFQKGINAEAFILGFSLSLLIYLLYWKKQMRQYDNLVKEPIIGFSTKKIFFKVFLILILFLILPLVFWSYISFFINFRSLLSFTTGAWILMWGIYLQLIY